MPLDRKYNATVGGSPLPAANYSNGKRGTGTGAELEGGGTGTSIFDPVLCELAYKWFSPERGSILDPFAGGSVRGIVAGYLGYKYTGIDLRGEQVAANKAQADEIINGAPVKWHCKDSLLMDEVLPTDEKFDFVFSCPPYYDLEVYSDNKSDISTADTYEEFLRSYNEIIKLSCSRLKENRFACFVVGDIRDKKGIYRNFVSDTISAFQKCNVMLYNEAILVTAVGSLPIRVGKGFGKYRKLGKTHQNVLVFYKGDARKIPEHFPELEGLSETELSL